MPRRSRTRRQRKILRANAPEYITLRRRGLNTTVEAFVPSWLQQGVRSTTRVLSNGINSLLREINTKRRRSLGETRRRSR